MSTTTESAGTEIAQRVHRVIEYQLGLAPTDVKAESKFIDDLGADSLDQIEIVMALEDEFGLEIDDERAEKILTVQQAVDYIAAHAEA